jgi:hypothetical protein
MIRILSCCLLLAAATPAVAQVSARDLYLSGVRQDSGQTASTAPLGLRYSIVRQTEKGPDEVDSGTMFHSGDKFRLRVEANDTGYLYLIERGSSNRWTLLFPETTIAGGDNVVQKGRVYDLPPGYWFEFDSRPGVEKLFLVLSRKPEPDLDRHVRALAERGGAPSAAEVTEEIVAGVRAKVQARDLVLQKVEHAVYVVNRSAGSDARLVLDIALRHE